MNAADGICDCTDFLKPILMRFFWHFVWLTIERVMNAPSNVGFTFFALSAQNPYLGVKATQKPHPPMKQSNVLSWILISSSFYRTHSFSALALHEHAQSKNESSFITDSEFFLIGIKMCTVSIFIRYANLMSIKKISAVNQKQKYNLRIFWRTMHQLK